MRPESGLSRDDPLIDGARAKQATTPRACIAHGAAIVFWRWVMGRGPRGALRVALSASHRGRRAKDSARAGVGLEGGRGERRAGGARRSSALRHSLQSSLFCSVKQSAQRVGRRRGGRRATGDARGRDRQRQTTKYHSMRQSRGGTLALAPGLGLARCFPLFTRRHSPPHPLPLVWFRAAAKL